MTKKILTVAVLLSMTVACTRETDEPLQYGELSVAISGEPVVEVLSKAFEPLAPESEEAENFLVRIYESDGGVYDPEAVVYESTFSDFEPQRLVLGEYTVTAEDCDVTTAESGKGQKRLFGSTQVTLSATELSKTAEIECSVANALVSVRFDDSVTGLFTDLKVTLSGGTTRTADIVILETHSGVESGYWFNPSDLTYTISGTFTGGGMNKPVEIVKTIALEAKNNIVLNVKVNLSGQLTPSISFDMEIPDPSDVEVEYNPYENN